MFPFIKRKFADVHVFFEKIPCKYLIYRGFRLF